jgi:hypothetical protein
MDWTFVIGGAFCAFIMWLVHQTTKNLKSERDFYKAKCIDLMAGSNQHARIPASRKLEREYMGIRSIRAGDATKPIQ